MAEGGVLVVTWPGDCGTDCVSGGMIIFIVVSYEYQTCQISCLGKNRGGLVYVCTVESIHFLRRLCSERRSSRA